MNSKSCEHMFVTKADKELEMCGLCGATYGEWHDGNVSTYRDGVYAERARSIKELEEQRDSMLSIAEDSTLNINVIYAYLQAIDHSLRRIKGEQK